MVRLTTEKLLNTQMHKLMPDCYTFNRWFVEYGENAGVVLSKDSIPTLAEFLSKNSRPVKDRGRLWCGDKRVGFARQSASFQKLRQFLVSNGLDDCWITRPGKGQSRLFPMTVLKHRDVRQLPFAYVCNAQMEASSFQKLLELFPGTKGVELTVAQVLTVTAEDVTSLTGERHNWLMGYDKVQSLRWFILQTQKKLKKAGIDSDDPFLNISFKVPRAPKRQFLRKKSDVIPLCELKHLKVPNQSYYYPVRKWRAQYGDPVIYFGAERWYGPGGKPASQKAA